jgi:hypothetical protein
MPFKVSISHEVQELCQRTFQIHARVRQGLLTNGSQIKYQECVDRYKLLYILTSEIFTKEFARYMPQHKSCCRFALTFDLKAMLATGDNDERHEGLLNPLLSLCSAQTCLGGRGA